MSDNKTGEAEASASLNILVFGATGATGKHIVQQALERKDNLTLFVRSLDKLSAEVKNVATTVVGDLTDIEAVSKAVKDAKPDVIIHVAGHLPKDAHGPLNSIAIPAMIKGLEECGLIKSCRFIFLSGTFAVPKGESLGFLLSTAKFFMVPMLHIQALVADNSKASDYLLHECSKLGLPFTLIRMGLVEESPKSKGVIKYLTKPPSNKVTFQDMGLFLLNLAHGQYKDETVGKQIFAGYK